MRVTCEPLAGCERDNKFLWSATACGGDTPPTKYRVVKGGGGSWAVGADPPAETCVALTKNDGALEAAYAARCCADEDEGDCEMPPTEKPTDSPTPSPTDTPVKILGERGHFCSERAALCGTATARRLILAQYVAPFFFVCMCVRTGRPRRPPACARASGARSWA